MVYKKTKITVIKVTIFTKIYSVYYFTPTQGLALFQLVAILLKTWD